jgi:glycosyltransferase involved in cell wall biosynthesis
MEWIFQTVGSILSQTINVPYEIVIGDDGSNDGSRELLEEKYGSLPQVRILVQERNNDIKEFSNWRHSRLIFRLLDEARGKYVSIIDGDDFFCDEHHFQRKIDYLERSENQNCVACYGNMYMLEEGKKELYTAVPYAEGQYLWQKDKIYIHLTTSVIRKKELEDVPRDIFYEAFADWGVTTWLMHKGMFYFDPTPGFVYRILPKSIWRAGSAELNALRMVISCDLDYRAYGARGQSLIATYKERETSIIKLYHNPAFKKKIDYEMWNGFTVKYHAKISWMLLNRDKLKLSEKLWLLIFCLRLQGIGKALKPKLIGISELLNPKVPAEKKKALFTGLFARMSGK